MPRVAETIEIPVIDIWAALFERKDRKFPDDQILFQCASTDRFYTYKQLQATARQIGLGLRAHFSFGKGDVVALFAQNSIDTPATTWGTHWAGGIVTPANPTYQVHELSHHLKASGAKLLITQKHLLEVAVKAAKEAGLAQDKVLLLGDEKWDGKVDGFRHVGDILAPAGTKGERTPLDATKDLAFLAFSSGTTGLPKAVMLTHANVVANMHQGAYAEARYMYWKQAKILSVLPFYHIYGLQFLNHIPVYVGATTIVMSSFDLRQFCSLIQKHKITYTYIAPPVALHLAKSPVIDEYDLSSLKFLNSGAAPLSKELIHQVYSRLGAKIKQAYGLTETSPGTHFQRVWLEEEIGTVGPSFPNQIVKIMDPDGNEVPEGQEGEIWIKGPNIFVGYYNNPAATKACLTDDGFFKTGDVGYEDHLGNLYITDRVKELIKYKGFQVAPAELEGILNGNELVNDVAVIGLYDESQQTELPLAFIVPKQGVEKSSANEKTIIDWIAQRVANHKRLRGGIRWMDEIPKSASGKILRRLLRDKLKEEAKLRAKL
ncbi:hypothetical protein F5884DRAFT_477361 [Xylogone sp. PMI_703]|nr:hypothetical protein F5884DRAFT_477361 [Xylogone sp. PMI_703]